VLIEKGFTEEIEGGIEERGDEVTTEER